MKIKIEFSCVNAAFGDEPHIEIGRILQDLSNRFIHNNMLPIWNRESDLRIKDINGNTIGQLTIVGRR